MIILQALDLPILTCVILIWKVIMHPHLTPDLPVPSAAGRCGSMPAFLLERWDSRMFTHHRRESATTAGGPALDMLLTLPYIVTTTCWMMQVLVWYRISWCLQCNCRIVDLRCITCRVNAAYYTGRHCPKIYQRAPMVFHIGYRLQTCLEPCHSSGPDTTCPQRQCYGMECCCSPQTPAKSKS